MKFQASASRDQFLSNAKNCNGKSSKDFSVWLESIPRYAYYTNRDTKEVAMMTPKGSLFSNLRELVLAVKNWPENHQQPFPHHTPRYTPQQNSQHTDTYTGSICPHS